MEALQQFQAQLTAGQQRVLELIQTMAAQQATINELRQREVTATPPPAMDRTFMAQQNHQRNQALAQIAEARKEVGGQGQGTVDRHRQEHPGPCHLCPPGRRDPPANPDQGPALQYPPKCFFG